MITITLSEDEINVLRFLANEEAERQRKFWAGRYIPPKPGGLSPGDVFAELAIKLDKAQKQNLDKLPVLGRAASRSV